MHRLSWCVVPVGWVSEMLFRGRMLSAGLLALAVASHAATAAPAVAPGQWQPLGPDGGVVTLLAFAPSGSGTVYAGTTPYGLPRTPLVFRSDDAGMSWHLAAAGLPASRTWSLAVDPDQPGTGPFPDAVTVSADGTVYATLFQGGIRRSTDGGTTWSAVPTGRVQASETVTSVAADPRDPARLLAATGGGGVLATADGGASWSLANGGLRATNVTAIAADPHHPSTLYAGTNETGLFKSRDSGAHWEAVGANGPAALPVSIETLATDAGRAQALYAGAAGAVWKTTDGDASWSFSQVDECSDLKALLADPTSQRLYAAGINAPFHGCQSGDACNVFTSRDGGASWDCMGNVYQASALALDPVHPSRLYLGDFDGGISSPVLLKSTDRGRAFFSSAAGLGNRRVFSLAVSPADDRIVYAGTEFQAAAPAAVWKSADAGATWLPVSTGLPPATVSVLIADPLDPAIVYAGVVASGVFRTLDGGLTWQPLGEGLPQGSFSGALALAAGKPRLLLAGTHGAGTFALPLR